MSRVEIISEGVSTNTYQTSLFQLNFKHLFICLFFIVLIVLYSRKAKTQTKPSKTISQRKAHIKKQKKTKTRNPDAEQVHTDDNATEFTTATIEELYDK